MTETREHGDQPPTQVDAAAAARARERDALSAWIAEVAPARAAAWVAAWAAEAARAAAAAAETAVAAGSAAAVAAERVVAEAALSTVRDGNPYAKMLKKYCDIVGVQEGVDFLSAGEWSPEEKSLWSSIDPTIDWSKR